MAHTTHVWLLEQASPPEVDALQPWLMERLADPGVLALPYAWLRVLVAWVLVRLRVGRHATVLAALPGPAPEVGATLDLAQALQRQLGRRYRCHGVLRQGRPDAASAAAEIKRGAHVVLLPLQLVSDATRQGLVVHARSALGPRRARLAQIDLLDEDTSVLAAVVRGIRQAILRLADRSRYTVLFCAMAQGESATPRVWALHRRLVGLLRLTGDHPLLAVRPFGIGTDPLGDAARTLDQLTDSRSVVVAPVGPLTHHTDVSALMTALGPALRDRGVADIQLAAPAAACPGLAHALYEGVKAAERDMAWDVPEDAVQADVEAELRRQGAVSLSRGPLT